MQPFKKKKFYLSRYPDNLHPKPILVPRADVSWEARAVFNPGVVKDGDMFHMLYRTYPAETIPTTPRGNRPGDIFAHRVSYIGYASSTDGKIFERNDVPFIAPDMPYDAYGCEDPRIVKINDTFYITYTAIDAPLDVPDVSPNIRIALATTKDFVTVEKHGIIGPPTKSKAAAFFSESVYGGRIGLALTISSDSVNSHVAVRYYDSMDDVLTASPESWDAFLATSMDTAVLSTYWWLHRGPELGAPPIKTDRGWLFIFSAESMSDSWTISAALTDLDEPHKLIARAPGHILQPAGPYERDGIVPNVTFPSGVAVVEDELYVYYGGADTVIGLATCKVNDLLDHLGEFCMQ